VLGSASAGYASASVQQLDQCSNTVVYLPIAINTYTKYSKEARSTKL